MKHAALGVAVMAVVVAGLALAGAPTPKGKAPSKRASASAPKKDGGTSSTALQFGTLELKVKGAATVFLDGRELGQTPLKPVKVLAGKHLLRLVNEALKLDQTADLDIRSGEVSTLEISFEQE